MFQDVERGGKKRPLARSQTYVTFAFLGPLEAGHRYNVKDDTYTKMRLRILIACSTCALQPFFHYGNGFGSIAQACVAGLCVGIVVAHHQQ